MRKKNAKALNIEIDAIITRAKKAPTSDMNIALIDKRLRRLLVKLETAAGKKKSRGAARSIWYLEWDLSAIKFDYRLADGSRLLMAPEDPPINRRLLKNRRLHLYSN